MDLIDLKKDPQPIDSNEMYEEPMYSYGLCISLGREELEKLGIEKLPEAGSEMMIKAITYVKTVRESKEKDGVEQNVELQICAMGIEPFDKSKDQADGLYGEKAATAPPKAEPATKTTTYLAQEVIMFRNLLNTKEDQKNSKITTIDKLDGNKLPYNQQFIKEYETKIQNGEKTTIGEKYKYTKERKLQRKYELEKLYPSMGGN